jgi:hypothetical protein
MRLGRPSLVLLLLAASRPAHAQLIVNGGFESTPASGGYVLVPGGSSAIPGWTTVLSGVEWFQPSANGFPPDSPNGGRCVDLACYTYPSGGIEQTLATVPGTTYSIGFSLGTHAVAGRNGTCEVVVSADGQSQSFTHTSVTAAIGWSPRTFQFIADDASATLRFACFQDPLLHFAYIDGVGAQMVSAGAGGSWGRIKSLYR